MSLNGGETACRRSYDEDRRKRPWRSIRLVLHKSLAVSFETNMKLSENLVEKLAFEFLNQAEIEFETKEMLFRRIRVGKSLAGLFLSSRRR